MSAPLRMSWSEMAAPAPPAAVAARIEPMVPSPGMNAAAMGSAMPAICSIPMGSTLSSAVKFQDWLAGS